MKATNWEFTNRALVFGLILACTFPLYVLDHENITAALATWFSMKYQTDGMLLARIIFAVAAAVMVVAALIRTWASAYLRAEVVYASEVKSASLVADGPYRYVRNPLYFANILMAFGMGALMSRAGFFVALAAIVAFCYRLIFREESELLATQGESYEQYRKAVPRLLLLPWPRIPSAGRPARWLAGFIAESWFWGFATAVIVFAATLKLQLFLLILGASVVWLSVMPMIFKEKESAQDSERESTTASNDAATKP